MSILFTEKTDSRQQTKASYTLRYTASREQDDQAVMLYALANTPAVVGTPFGNMFRQDITLEPVGYANYTVTVPYGPRQRATGSYTWNFDTTGGTVRIKAAKEHVASYENGGSVSGDWHKGAIGVQQDGSVEGTDVVIPALKLNVTFRHPQGVVTFAKAKALARATGGVNSAPFLTFSAGELLFLGGTGSDGSEADAEVTYQFAASENVNDLSFGAIANIVKAGHHVAWVEFEDDVEDGNPITPPKRVHIERVYTEINFADALGWS